MNTRVLRVIKNGNRAPAMNLIGEWLSEFGFHADVLVLGEFSKGCVILTAKGAGIEVYKELVTSIRAGGKGLFQVSARKYAGRVTTALPVAGKLLLEAGFAVGDVYAVYCEQDVLTIIKIDNSAVLNRQ